MPKGSKVLMADDDKMLLDMYRERLELAGYNVVVARNGEEGLAKSKEVKPDIILLDIMMPKLNGYEALASIKSDPSTKDVPVVMLSALMRDFNREKAVEAGADDYLIKSEAMPSDVITKIEQVLQKYGKGTTPAPGMVASSIPTPTAQPQVNPVAPKPTPQEAQPQETPKPEITEEKKPETKPEENKPADASAPLVNGPETKPEETKEEIKPVMEPQKSTPVEQEKQVEQEKKEIDEAAVSPEEIVFESEKEGQNNTTGAFIDTSPGAIPAANQTATTPAPFVPVATQDPETKAKPEKAEKPNSMLLVIIVALVVALINDLIIYFFFMSK